MFIDIAWQREHSQTYRVSVGYSPSLHNITIGYPPNVTFNAAWLDGTLISAEVQPRSGIDMAQLLPAIVNHQDAKQLVEIWQTEAPWRIGLPIEMLVQARRPAQTNIALLPGLTLSGQTAVHDYFVIWDELLLPAVKANTTAAAIFDELLTTYLLSRARGQILPDLIGTERSIPLGISTEALVVAAGTVMDAYINDRLSPASLPDPDAQILDGVAAVERLIAAGQLIDALLGVERTHAFTGSVLELTSAWQEAKAALTLTTFFAADETLSDGRILEETLAGVTEERRAAVLETLKDLAVRMVNDGTLFALSEAMIREQPIPAKILDDTVDMEPGPRDPWDDIWAIYQAGQDDIVVPGKDYDYTAKFATMVDPVTGKVLEPLSDPAVADVVVRVPASNPFPFADEKRRRVVSLSIEKQLLRIIAYYRELSVAEIPTWSVPQAMQQTLNFMYAAIKQRFAGLSYEPYYLRGFRLFRWYAEKALYEQGKYLLQRTFAPWVAPLASGFLDVNWSGTGISFAPGKIICTGTGELVIATTAQIHGDCHLTLTIPADATATLERIAGAVALTTGMNTITLAATDQIHMTFSAPTSVIEITNVDRDGYWLQEYTIMPVFEAGAAALVLDRWQQLLMEYYNKHHEQKTKGTRYFHLHG